MKHITLLLMLFVCQPMTGEDKRALADACRGASVEGTELDWLTTGHDIGELRKLIRSLPDLQSKNFYIRDVCADSNIYFITGKLGKKKEVAWLMDRLTQLDQYKPEPGEMNLLRNSKIDILYGLGIMTKRGIQKAKTELTRISETPGPLQYKARMILKTSSGTQ